MPSNSLQTHSMIASQVLAFVESFSSAFPSRKARRAGHWNTSLLGTDVLLLVSTLRWSSSYVQRERKDWNILLLERRKPLTHRSPNAISLLIVEEISSGRKDSLPSVLSVSHTQAHTGKEQAPRPQGSLLTGTASWAFSLVRLQGLWPLRRALGLTDALLSPS